MRRTAIGIIALVLLIAAAVLVLGFPDSDTDLWVSAFIRVGVLMAVIWLAYEQVARAPVWLLVIFAMLVVPLIVWKQPRTIILLFIAAVIVYRLRPLMRQ